ncbi:hypothetical protein ABBQ38_010746 [Trebouxia sp. C0009 RCD-2024]
MVYSYQFGVQTIAPALGCVLTIGRSLVPIRDVLNVRKDRRLGELNPTPFAAMILNHTGWVVYAVLHTDWFIFTMDSSGLIIGIWMMFSLYPLAHTQVQNRLNGLVVVAAILYCTLALVSMILNAVNSPAIPLLWGWAVAVTQVLLYAAPLSTLYKAIKARSSASFHLGMAILGFLSSAMWTIYGGTESKYFICVPSFLGAVLTLAAIGVCALLPRVESGPPTLAAQTQQRMTSIERAVELQVV